MKGRRHLVSGILDLDLPMNHPIPVPLSRRDVNTDRVNNTSRDAAHEIKHARIPKKERSQISRCHGRIMA